MPPRSQPRTSTDPVTLYRKCMEREGLVAQADLKWLRTKVYEQLQFEGPFFQPDEQFDSAISVTDSHDVKIQKGLRSGTKYRDLLGALKNAGTREARWVLLAWWLNQEKVCEPPDFLPKEANLERLAKKVLRGFSAEDVR